MLHEAALARSPEIFPVVFSELATYEYLLYELMQMRDVTNLETPFSLFCLNSSSETPLLKLLELFTNLQIKLALLAKNSIGATCLHNIIRNHKIKNKLTLIQALLSIEPRLTFAMDSQGYLPGVLLIKKGQQTDLTLLSLLMNEVVLALTSSRQKK